MATCSASYISSMTTRLPSKYADPVYQEAHRGVFEHPSKHEVPQILPPGVAQEDFQLAIREFCSAVGEGFVFIGHALSDYIDPYDPYESDETKRRIPSAAVW